MDRESFTAGVGYASNMRSDPVAAGGQECLPLDPQPPVRAAPARTSGRRPEDEAIRHRMTDDALASIGWPAGTELVLEACTAPRRGQVVLAREGDRLRVGIFDVQLGRAALRTDHGSVWIGHASQVIGAVTVANVPLLDVTDC